MSGTNNQLLSEYHQYLDNKEAFLDSYIDAGSDHELFTASYIHGHFSVVAANILNIMNDEENRTLDIIEWQDRTKLALTNSIGNAIANNELSDKDASDVIFMQDALFKQ